MSTRFYPRFVKGNPQLRIFLPDWKMILVKSEKKLPDNVVTFKVEPKMTDWDVKNYLQKIYKVEIGAIKSYIRAGPLKRTKGGVGLTKGFDYKIVNVTLPIGQTFEFPDIFPAEKFDEEISDFKRTMKEVEKNRKRDPNIIDVPSWFS